MNAKYRATRCKRVAGALALVLGFAPVWASADDGNLSQPLRIQQQKSRFQLMLEQVQESARRRAAQAPTARVGAPDSPAINARTESVRLDPVSVTDSSTTGFDSDSDGRLRKQQAFERDQQRILNHRQRRRALIGAGRHPGANSFAAKRGELARYNAQNQQQSLQRRLRR